MKRQKFLNVLTGNRVVTQQIETIEKLLEDSVVDVLDLHEVERVETLLSFRLSSVLSEEAKLKPFEKILKVLVRLKSKDDNDGEPLVNLIARQIACSTRAFHNLENKGFFSNQYFPNYTSVMLAYKDDSKAFEKDLELLNESLTHFGVRLSVLEISTLEICVSV